MTTTSHGRMQEILDFLRDKHSDFDPADADRDLIDSRILNSVDFAEFLMLLAEFADVPVDLSDFEVDTIRTVRAIADHYFSGAMQ